MKVDRFQEIINEQLQYCLDVLVFKADEYATSDRLHNFKMAANLQGCTPVQALGGMMAKHTISIYDMINDMNIGKDYSNDIWKEKITDHINYLLLLTALLHD